MSEQPLFGEDSWAIVEVLGRHVFAGRTSEHILGNTVFIRVDVPEVPAQQESYGRTTVHHTAIPGFTKFIGGNSIYAITPCTEAVARMAAEKTRSTPITVLDLPQQEHRSDHPRDVLVFAALEEPGGEENSCSDDDCPFEERG